MKEVVLIVDDKELELSISEAKTLKKILNKDLRKFEESELRKFTIKISENVVE